MMFNLPFPFMEAMLVAIMAMMVAMIFHLPVPLMEATRKAFVAIFGILETMQQHL